MNFDMQAVEDLVRRFDPDIPTGDPFLDHRFELHRVKFGHPMPYWRLFYQLTDLVKPAFSVELGAWQATCAAHMAAGYPFGDVLTIDHHSDPGDEANKPLAEEAANRYQNLYYLQGWTWDVVDRVRAWGSEIDLLFIDSWHHYDRAMRDWDDYRPLLASPALVVCDDIVNSEPTLHRMVEFWEEISRGREGFLVTGDVHFQYPMGFMRWER